MCKWNDPELHDLAVEFFRTFSRLEYALKAVGHLKPNRKAAEADWTLFAQSIHEGVKD